MTGNLDPCRPAATASWAASTPACGVGKDGEKAVPEPLDDPSVTAGEGGLDCSRDLAQQLHRRLVARLERPGGEPDQVGEEDRDLLVPRPRPCASETACQTCRAPSPSSRVRLSRAGATSDSPRARTCGARSPAVDNGSPSSESPGRRERRYRATETRRGCSSVRLALSAVPSRRPRSRRAGSSSGNTGCSLGPPLRRMARRARPGAPTRKTGDLCRYRRMCSSSRSTATER